VDPIGGDTTGNTDAQIFHPGDGRGFYGGISCSW
jgi:hypothetical protein